MSVSKVGVIALLITAVLAGVGAYAYHVAKRVLVLRIATGPAGGFGGQFAVSVVHLVSLEHPRVRVRVTNMPSEGDALKALAAGEADVAVARTDSPGPMAQTIAVLRRDVGVFVVPHNSKVQSVSGLRGVTIGVTGVSEEANGRLLETVRKAYGLPDQPAFLPLAPNAIAEALRSKKIGAVFAVGPAGGQTIKQALAAMRTVGGGQPHLIVVDEADAIAKRNQLLESVDLPKGVLQGQPPYPDDDASTIGVSTRLFATSAMPNSIAAEITRMMLADKPRVASLMPVSAVIEAPDTDNVNASLPIHPGASAYLSGNQPSVSDEAQNVLYWIGIGASIFASFAAALTALVRRFAPKRPEATLKLLDLWVVARDAPKIDLDQIEAQVDAVVHEVVKKQASSNGEEISAAFPLIVSQVKRMIDRRRAEPA